MGGQRGSVGPDGAGDAWETPPPPPVQRNATELRVYSCIAVGKKSRPQDIDDRTHASDTERYKKGRDRQYCMTQCVRIERGVSLRLAAVLRRNP